MYLTMRDNFVEDDQSFDQYDSIFKHKNIFTIISSNIL